MSDGAVAVRHGHEANIRRTARYAVAAFALSLAGNVGDVGLTTWNQWPVAWPLVAGKAATAAVGPALIGAGLELFIRRPPATPGATDWPLVGRWRDFPIVGYLVVMMIGFALSFDHLRDLAELVGVPAPFSSLLPIGIDLAAVSVTFDHAQSKRALERITATDLEAAAAARVAAETAERERVEAEHQAAIENQRLTAERETARLAAEAEANRRATTEARTSRARSEIERAEPEPSQGNRSTAMRSNGGEPGSTSPQGKGTRSSIEDLAEILAVEPDLSTSEAAERLDVTERTIRRWRGRLLTAAR